MKPDIKEFEALPKDERRDLFLKRVEHLESKLWKDDEFIGGVGAERIVNELNFIREKFEAAQSADDVKEEEGCWVILKKLEEANLIYIAGMIDEISESVSANEEDEPEKRILH